MLCTCLYVTIYYLYRQTIAELERLIEDLQKRGSEQSGASEAELVRFSIIVSILVTIDCCSGASPVSTGLTGPCPA